MNSLTRGAGVIELGPSAHDQVVGKAVGSLDQNRSTYRVDRRAFLEVLAEARSLYRIDSGRIDRESGEPARAERSCSHPAALA